MIRLPVESFACSGVRTQVHYPECGAGPVRRRLGTGVGVGAPRRTGGLASWWIRSCVTLVVVVAVAVAVAGSGIARAQGQMSNAEALRRGWEAWRALSELTREQLAPRLLEWSGKAGGTAHLATTTVDNASRYRALCGRRAGAFRTAPLCQAMQFRLGERSAMSTVLLALHRRAGTQNETARDAAAILAGLRMALGLETARLPATPQHVLAGLYTELGRCALPACSPGQQAGSALSSWLSAAARLIERHGSDVETAAARRLKDLGWS